MWKTQKTNKTIGDTKTLNNNNNNLIKIKKEINNSVEQDSLELGK
jgi:hypothetical protein